MVRKCKCKLSSVVRPDLLDGIHPVMCDVFRCLQSIVAVVFYHLSVGARAGCSPVFPLLASCRRDPRARRTPPPTNGLISAPPRLRDLERHRVLRFLPRGSPSVAVPVDVDVLLSPTVPGGHARGWRLQRYVVVIDVDVVVVVVEIVGGSGYGEGVDELVDGDDSVGVLVNVAEALFKEIDQRGPFHPGGDVIPTGYGAFPLRVLQAIAQGITPWLQRRLEFGFLGFRVSGYICVSKKNGHRHGLSESVRYGTDE